MALYDEKTGDLIVWLKTQAAITSRVGTGTAAQIYPRREQQDITGQALVFDRVTGQQYQHVAGETKIRRDVVHFYSYGDTNSQSEALDEALHDAFCPGGVQTRNATWGASNINLVRKLDGPTYGEDAPVKADARYRYWTMSAYEIFVRQT